MISETELAWVAGFSDGEAYIGVEKRKPRGQHKSPEYLPTIEIANTNQGVVKFLRDLFGGRVQPDLKRKPSEKQAYKWAIHSKQAVHVLKELCPYLRLKQKQVELVLELAEGIGHFYGNHQRLPDAEIMRREEIYQKVKVLNSRGSAGLERGFQETMAPSMLGGIIR